jgi:hypothetical protein
MSKSFIIFTAMGGTLMLSSLVGWIVWMDARRRQANFKAATDFRHKLLDKFTSTTEFISFVKTDEGQGFLNLPAEGRPSPLDRIIRFVQVGAILTFVGATAMAGALATPGPPGVGTIIGGCIAAAGIGALVAAFISYRLMQKWGLITHTAATNARAAVASEAKTASNAEAKTEAKDSSDTSETKAETVPQAKAS